MEPVFKGYAWASTYTPSNGRFNGVLHVCIHIRIPNEIFSGILLDSGNHTYWADSIGIAFTGEGQFEAAKEFAIKHGYTWSEQAVPAKVDIPYAMRYVYKKLRPRRKLK